MKLLVTWTFIMAFIFNGCAEPKRQQDSIQITEEDKNDQVLNLIKQTLVWADSENSIGLLPIILEDSIYTRFDLELHQQNLEKLRETNFFSGEFIDNYDNIIRNLDKKLRNNEFEFSPWHLGDLPPFNFASETNPWCNCQDNLNWETVQIKKLDNEDFVWTWGDLDGNTHQSWKDFRYRFSVEENEDRLKISYMEGFEFEK